MILSNEVISLSFWPPRPVFDYRAASRFKKICLLLIYLFGESINLIDGSGADSCLKMLLRGCFALWVRGWEEVIGSADSTCFCVAASLGDLSSF